MNYFFICKTDTNIISYFNFFFFMWKFSQNYSFIDFIQSQYYDFILLILKKGFFSQPDSNTLS